MDERGPREHVLRIACSKWREDGPWPPPWGQPCGHVRAEIGLPIDIEVLGELAKVLRCSCGAPTVILGRAPESVDDPDQPSSEGDA